MGNTFIKARRPDRILFSRVLSLDPRRKAGKEQIGSVWNVVDTCQRIER